ncbi:MAG: hypothetical protein WC375_10655, partial [Methanomassiliicoccales archaeon]
GASGPIWLGDIIDHDFIQKMPLLDTLAEKDRCAKYLQLWKEELNVPFFYENNELSSDLHVSPLRLERLLEGMSEIGKVSKTHFSPTGFKCDQPYSVVKERYRQLFT